MVGPGAKAVLAAQKGASSPLQDADVKPGRIAWMPWAGVIKVTHNQRHKGKSDGVEVLGESEGERPSRRAWNHPAVIIKRDGEKVFILALTTFKGQSLDQKFAKFSDHNKKVIVARMIPMELAPEHPFYRQGDRRYKTLTFASGSKMSRPGYIKMETVYKMDWRDLERYPRHGKDGCQLDEESVTRVLDLLSSVNSRGWRLTNGT